MYEKQVNETKKNKKRYIGLVIFLSACLLAGTFSPMKSMADESTGAAETMETVESTETMESTETVGSTETVESMETGEATETTGNSADMEPSSGNSSITAEINGYSRTYMVNSRAAAVTVTAWNTAVTTYGWDETFLRNTAMPLPDGTESPDRKMLEGGDGSSESQAYIINSPEALAWFAYMVNTQNSVYGAKCVILGADIDLFGQTYSGYEGTVSSDTIGNAVIWNPIAFGSSYSGIFDGAGHTVDNMNLPSSLGTTPRGLFGSIGSTGIVKNLTIKGNNDGVYVGGGISGTCAGQITQCYNFVKVNASSGHNRYCGGITGHLQNGGRISYCANYGLISDLNWTNTMCTGGISGRAESGSIIENCFNSSKILFTTSYSGNTKNSGYIVSPYGFAGTVVNCYYNDSITYVSGDRKPSVVMSGVTGKTETQLKTWAAAFALNGQKMDGSWQYTEGQFPSIGNLDAATWEQVGQGMIDGFITADIPAGDATSGYTIDTPEKLAWFALHVNTGADTIVNAALSANIDLMGTKYGGTPGLPIRWNPIGTIENKYLGTFDGAGMVIANMRVEEKGVGGMFGVAGDGIVIKRLGLDATCSVKVAKKDADDTRHEGVGALVGLITEGSSKNEVLIENCYTRASIESGTDVTGSLVGYLDYLTYGVGEYKIKNCFAAGPIAVTNVYAKGGIAGKFNQGEFEKSGMRNCYWDENVTGASSVVRYDLGSTNLVATIKKTTAEMKSDDMIALLNADLSTPIWTRSDDKNNGYPSFNITPPVTYADWEAVGVAVSAPSYGHAASAITPGTPGNPYFIKSPEDLAWFANQVNNVEGQTGLCGKLMVDLNLYGSVYNGENAYDSTNDPSLDKALPWVPIGKSQDAGKGYTGTFDGNGHTVSVIKTKETTSRLVGLFGILGSNATIKNLGIGKGPVRLTGLYTGGIAGYIQGTDVALTGCWNEGTLTGMGDDAIGGILGNSGASSNNLVINGCYNIGTVNSSTASRLGGIVGTLTSVTNGTMTVQNCYNRGTVNGTRQNAVAGGIVGVLTATGTVKQCYQAGEVTVATANAIVGIKNGNVEHCFYDTSYTATDTAATGIYHTNFATWGAAFGLNGESLSQTGDISWTYESGEYPTYGTLSGAESWDDVGRAAEQGFITITKPNTEPFKLGSAVELAWFEWKIAHGYALRNAVLTADIDLFGAEYTGYTGEKTIENIDKALKWKPIGPSAIPYMYVFDGGGHHITSLNVSETMYAGFFGLLENATVKNITIQSGQIEGVDRVGGLAGGARGTTIIENCHNAATVNSIPASSGSATSCNTGGVIGATIESSTSISLTMKQCSNRGNVNGYREAGGILGDGNVNSGSSITIENCWNLGNITQTSTRHGTYGFSGIAGIVRTDRASISNCYNAGIITTSGRSGAIMVYDSELKTKTVTNCYYEKDLAGANATTENTVGLTREQLQSWPAAFALNVQSITGPWKYTEGQYPDFGTLDPAGSWEQIGEGIEWGLIKDKKPSVGDGSDGSPYQLSTPEAFGWFAYKVNSSTDNQNWNADLTTNISLVGTAYGGQDDSPIPWIPIGTYNGVDETKGYGGIFGAGHQRVYQIQKLYIKTTGLDRLGLFGQLIGTAKISDIGLVDAVIEAAGDGSAASAGSIAGRMMGTGTVISRCYSRNAEIHAGGINGGMAGGLTGGMNNSSTIQDCYTMDSSIISEATVATASAFAASGIASSITSGSVIKNCYTAGNTLTATTYGGGAGNTYSIGNTIADITVCYSDNISTSEAGKVKELAKTQAQADSLNMVDGTPETERKGDARVWYTSLNDESTRGYPTFDKPVVLNVTMDPAEVSLAGWGYWVASEGVWDGETRPPDGALYRGIHQVEQGEGQPEFILPKNTKLIDYYYTYGSNNANQNIGINAGNTDLYDLTGSLTEPVETIDSCTQRGGLRMFVTSAYNYPHDRTLILELAEKTGSGANLAVTRYEVWIKVKGVTSKTLTVTMKTPVSITLEPGVSTTAYTEDLVLSNNNTYPIEVTVSGVAAIPQGESASDGTVMDVALKPIASHVTIDDTKALVGQGVKLGIAKPKAAPDTGAIGEEKLYYTPPAAEGTAGTWMKADIGYNQGLGYRYFIDHSMLHIGPQQKFGFKITYQFTIPEADVSGVSVTAG